MKRDNYLNVRAYSWSLITYATSNEVHQFILEHLDIIKYYAYIVHDNDIKDDGTPKEKHIHLLLVFNYSIQLGAIINKMRFECNTMGEPMRDKVSAYNYLTHKDNCDKYQYNELDIITNNKEYFLSTTTRIKKEDENFKYLELIEDLCKGYTFRDMIIKYGRDFIIHYKQYQEMAYFVLNEKKVIIDDECNIWDNNNTN